MALIHAREVDKTPVSEEPTEEIVTGELVTREAGGGCHPTDPATDDEVDGIVLQYENGDHIAAHNRDFRGHMDDFTYDPNDDDQPVLVPIQLTEERATFRPYTVKDDTLPAPSIQRLTTVGVVTINGEQHVVEDGYEYDGTTYSEEGAGDFLAFGTAEVDPYDEINEHETLVPVRV